MGERGASAGQGMLRGADRKHPSSTHAARLHSGHGMPGFAPPPLRRRQDAALERRTGLARVLGFCGWALAGAAAFLAIWEIGNFSVLVGNGPLLPAVVREAPSSGVFRPAEGPPADSDDGCTQAQIDRSNGRTTTMDCHTSVPGREAVLALLSRSLLP
jgi:hypothetical protein